MATRRAEVSKLYPTMSITEIAHELGCSRKPVEDDVNGLAAAGVLTKRPRGRIPGTKLGRESCEKIAAAKRGRQRPEIAAKMRAAWADPVLREHRRASLQRVPRETRKCQWCDEPYEVPATSPQRYCSIACNDLEWWDEW
jgi:DNA-binding Lrp family transcriptional regulator